MRYVIPDFDPGSLGAINTDRRRAFAQAFKHFQILKQDQDDT